MNMPVSPSAPDSPWSTPVGSASPIVDPSPYTNEVAETPDPIVSPGVTGAKADDVAATVAGSVAAAEARFHAHEADTHAQGSVIGDLMSMPPSYLDPAASSPGTTLPSGAFFDPPRGGAPETFPNTGNEPR